MYGSDALAGVVNLIPQSAGGRNRMSGNVTTEYISRTTVRSVDRHFYPAAGKVSNGGPTEERLAKDFQNSVDGRYSCGLPARWMPMPLFHSPQVGQNHLRLSMYDNQRNPDGSRDSLSRSFTKQVTEDDAFRPVVSQQELNDYRISFAPAGSALPGLSQEQFVLQ